MLPAARTFRLAAGFLCFNRGDDFFRKNGILKMRKANAARIQNRPTYKKGSCAEIYAAAFCLCNGCALLNAGNRIILCFHGLLQHLIVHFGVQGNDGGTGFVADNSLVHLRQSLQRLLDAGFTVGAHHTFYG